MINDYGAFLLVNFFNFRAQQNKIIQLDLIKLFYCRIHWQLHLLSKNLLLLLKIAELAHYSSGQIVTFVSWKTNYFLTFSWPCFLILISVFRKINATSQLFSSSKEIRSEDLDILRTHHSQYFQPWECTSYHATNGSIISSFVFSVSVWLPNATWDRGKLLSSYQDGSQTLKSSAIQTQPHRLSHRTTVGYPGKLCVPPTADRIWSHTDLSLDEMRVAHVFFQRESVRDGVHGVKFYDRTDARATTPRWSCALCFVHSAQRWCSVRFGDWRIYGDSNWPVLSNFYRRVNTELALQCTDADLLILEGMGRYVTHLCPKMQLTSCDRKL